MNKNTNIIVKTFTCIALTVALLSSASKVSAADINSNTEYWGPKIFKWYDSADNQFGVAVLWEGSKWIPASTVSGTYNTYAHNDDAGSAWEKISSDCENDPVCVVRFPNKIKASTTSGDVVCTVVYGQGEICGVSTVEEELVHIPVAAGLPGVNPLHLVGIIGSTGAALFLLSQITKKIYILDR